MNETSDPFLQKLIEQTREDNEKCEILEQKIDKLIIEMNSDMDILEILKEVLQILKRKT